MSTVGDILSTMGDVQYDGGYHDACGGYREYRGVLSTLWDIIFYYLKTSTVLNIPTCIMISPHGTQITKDGIPTVLIIPPHVP